MDYPLFTPRNVTRLSTPERPLLKVERYMDGESSFLILLNWKIYLFNIMKLTKNQYSFIVDNILTFYF